VPYHTLRNRFLGKSKAPEDAHANQQFLSPEQERVLADWLQHLGDTGHPLDKRSIREAARAIAGKLPSRGWVRLFCARHPNIVMGKGSSLDPKRAQAFNRPVVTRHFELLKKIMEEHGIPWENVYNMDEKGCQRGSRKGSNRKHFFARNKRPKYKIRSGNLELVTIIECVCADGSSLLPGFVFPGNGNYCPEWFTHSHLVIFSIATSPNGWTDDYLCEKWFEDSFLPQAKARNTSGKPILLIYDGHGSHEGIKMVRLGRENNIILFCLPPHTTHMLQPLDVGVFGPFQRAWIDRCDEVVADTGAEMAIRDFVREYMGVRNQTFKATTIISAFKKSGIRPLNP
ncbi:DDE-domain-containing protein, partial [Athelia psychrophila]